MQKGLRPCTFAYIILQSRVCNLCLLACKAQSNIISVVPQAHSAYLHPARQKKASSLRPIVALQSRSLSDIFLFLPPNLPNERQLGRSSCIWGKVSANLDCPRQVTIIISNLLPLLLFPASKVCLLMCLQFQYDSNHIVRVLYCEVSFGNKTFRMRSWTN